MVAGVVEALKGREDERGFLPAASLEARFKAGEPVRVRDGAFADSCGIFEAAGDNERVAILLDLLGRKVRVLLDTRAVEAA